MSKAVRLLILSLAAGCLLAEAASANAVPKRNNQLNGNGFDVTNLDISNLDDEPNNVWQYDPIEPKKTEYKTQSSSANNKLKSSSFTDVEREEADKRDKDMTVRAVIAAESESKDSSLDRAKDIALNSREVRLVGPNQREVEMRDDMASKFVVAMENLQKEASDVWGQVNQKLDKGWTELKRSEVWGQVNEKLDKGWTDLKTMVEGVVSPQTKQQAPTVITGLRLNVA